MKETYFTHSSIELQTQDFLRELAPYRRRCLPQFAVENSALLVLDMQRYFLEQSSHAFIPSAAAILTGIQALIQAYYDHSRPIFFTRHVNSLENAGCMASWWRELLRAENPLSEIAPQLDVSCGEVVVKSQYDAFFDTHLEDRLRLLDVRQVVICGVMTHLCCETTARSAFMHGFEVFFMINGTATYNTAFHRASLVNLAHGFAVPMQVNEILAAMQVHGD